MGGNAIFHFITILINSLSIRGDYKINIIYGYVGDIHVEPFFILR